jgi:hypothetical protein
MIDARLMPERSVWDLTILLTYFRIAISTNKLSINVWGPQNFCHKGKEAKTASSFPLQRNVQQQGIREV